MNKTPPRYPKREPNTPGRWLFTGTAWTMVGTEEPTVELRRHPFNVVEVEGQLTICDVDSGKPYVVQQFIGWWIEDLAPKETTP